MSPLPSTFHIKQSDTLLAILTVCKPSGEMFWLTCHFEPTDAFAAVKPLYDKLAQIKDMEEIIRIDNLLLEQGIVLLDVATGKTTPYFSMFVDGNRVTLRYADEEV